MSEKKIMDVEDLMLDYAEMTSFDFGSLSDEEMATLNKITNNEYAKKPYPFKYGKIVTTSVVGVVNNGVRQLQNC